MRYKVRMQPKYKLGSIQFSILFIIVFLVFTLYVLDLTTIRTLRFSILNSGSQNQSLLYDVSTSVCKIPKMDPFDKSVKKLISHTKQFCWSKEKLVQSNETHLTVNKHAFSQYYIKDKYSCYYQGFWRKPPVKDQKDKQIEWNQTKIYFEESVKVTEEFVKVICKNGRKQVYLDYFAFVPFKKIPDISEKDENFSTNSSTKLNILIIGLDSVSRLNFYRQMPKTQKFVEAILGGIEFFGSNKVGDNTYPNLMAAFAGKSDSEIHENCHKKNMDRFDNCDFIWGHLHKNGYVTGFAEEMTKYGLFTYNKGGFSKVPIMHYWETFGVVLENDMDANNLYMKKCNGYRPSLPYLLDYTIKFLKTYNNLKNYWFLSWESHYTHDVLNYDRKIDENYLVLLKNLYEAGYLNNTVLFFMSDHGLRFGPILNFYEGRMEERLPFFYIILPEWFKDKNPEIVENLKINSRRLTTHFDLYETMQAILKEDYSTFPEEKRGISLFKEIPESRTCESAGIPPHWCVCKPITPVSTSNATVQWATNYVLTHLNKILSNHTTCAPLVLNHILDAGVLVENFIKTKIQAVHYTVVFETNPGGALFEATVTCQNCQNDFDMAGPVSRNNLYGHQSDCVNDSVLKLYCFCI